MEKNYLVRFDYAIKTLLRNKSNFAILEGFIEVFLGRKCTIEEILESESNQEDADDKFNRVDIKAKDMNGELFIVEVQTTRYTYFLERILYGVSKAITEQLKIGGKYGDIKQVYSISIVYYDLGEGKDYFYECKSDFVGVHTHDVLKLNRREQLSLEEISSGDTRQYKYEKKLASDIFPKYYLIRINAFRKVVADAMDEWMAFLKDNSIKETTTVPGLIQAKEQLKYSKMSPQEKQSYRRHLDAVDMEIDVVKNSKADGFAEGKAVGRAEGRAEGEKQAIYDIARKMKTENYPIDIIEKITGLTLDEINNL